MKSKLLPAVAIIIVRATFQQCFAWFGSRSTFFPFKQLKQRHVLTTFEIGSRTYQPHVTFQPLVPSNKKVPLCSSSESLTSISTADTQSKDANAGGENDISITGDGDAERAQSLFVSLAGNAQCRISLEQIRSCNEIAELISSGLLMNEEVDELFMESLTDSTAINDTLNLEEFTRFINALDDMFEDVTEEYDSVELPSLSNASGFESYEDSASDSEIDIETISEYVYLAGSLDGMIEFSDVLRWSYVTELIEEGNIDVDELKSMWESTQRKKNSKMNFNEFIIFKSTIEDLFTYEDDDVESKAESKISTHRGDEGSISSDSSSMTNKSNLDADDDPSITSKNHATVDDLKKSLLSEIESVPGSCGMNCENETKQRIKKIVDELIVSDDKVRRNIVEKGIDKCIDGLVGNWRLLYSSSTSFQFNQGVTGIARTFSGAKFNGLTQRLERAGEFLDCKYIEELGNIEVEIIGSWEVRESTSVLSGKKTTVLVVSTKRVKYGFIDVIGERWKPLRSMALLHIAYLDEDLRIMRGQTISDVLFVLRRI